MSVVIIRVINAKWDDDQAERKVTSRNSLVQKEN
jgi:hypothetical protein